MNEVTRRPSGPYLIESSRNKELRGENTRLRRAIDLVEATIEAARA